MPKPSSPGRPPFLFLFHPALGPTWDVVAQKIKGGALAEGSELVLEVAEARVVDLRVKGSLLVSADSPLGHWTAPFAPSHSSPSSSSCWSATAAAAGDTEPEEALLIYSSRNGRARLEGRRGRQRGRRLGQSPTTPPSGATASCRGTRRQNSTSAGAPSSTRAA